MLPRSRSSRDQLLVIWDCRRAVRTSLPAPPFLAIAPPRRWRCGVTDMGWSAAWRRVPGRRREDHLRLGSEDDALAWCEDRHGGTVLVLRFESAPLAA
jgi:hypothetical protein